MSKSCYGIPTKFKTVFPVTLTNAQPRTISTSPGQNRSVNLNPPWPKAIAFGGVLMRNGTPKDAETAINIAVEGDGIRAVASGINNTAVAVLLIKAERNALARHNKNRLIVGSKSANGTFSARALTMAACSSNLPNVIPPAIRRSVDQSIRTRSFFESTPERNNAAADPRAITAAETPCSGSLNHRVTVMNKIIRKPILFDLEIGGVSFSKTEE